MLVYEIGMKMFWFDGAKIKFAQSVQAGRKTAQQAAATPRSACARAAPRARSPPAVPFLTRYSPEIIFLSVFRPV